MIVLFLALCVVHKDDGLWVWGRTLCNAHGRDPGVEGRCGGLQVEGLQVGLGALLCHEAQLGVFTGLQRGPQEKQE